MRETCKCLFERILVCIRNRKDHQMINMNNIRLERVSLEDDQKQKFKKRYLN